MIHGKAEDTMSHTMSDREAITIATATGIIDLRLRPGVVLHM